MLKPIKRFLLLLILLPALFSIPLVTAYASGGPGFPTTTIYVQLFDSCQNAMGGGSFTLTGNGQNQTSVLAPGVSAKFSKVNCPVQHGSCVTTQVGCVSFVVPRSWWQSFTYTIVPAQVAPKAVACNNNFSCPHGPETATIVVYWDHATATVKNIEKNGTVQTFPVQGMFTGTAADPVAFYEFVRKG